MAEIRIAAAGRRVAAARSRERVDGALFGRFGLALGLAIGLAACGGDPCIEEAMEARALAVDRFDAEDTEELSYANIRNRPARRAETGRLAYSDALTVCRATE